jgi:hypothetical protein
MQVGFLSSLPRPFRRSYLALSAKLQELGIVSHLWSIGCKPAKLTFS